jgi:hypothetical protein
MNDNALIVDIEAVGIDRAADYLEPVEAPSNYKNEDAKAKYIAEATAKAIDRCGLDPDLCKFNGDVSCSLPEKEALIRGPILEPESVVPA